MKKVKFMIEVDPGMMFVIGVILTRALDGDCELGESLPDEKKDEIIEFMGTITAEAMSKCKQGLTREQMDDMADDIADRIKGNPLLKKWYDVIKGTEGEDDKLFFT